MVIEAPARSGALNTAGWAAGRIPVLAVPGDVDRTHVQGCLALIRDGAILARHAGDVLEALGGQAGAAAGDRRCSAGSDDPMPAPLSCARSTAARRVSTTWSRRPALAPPAALAALACSNSRARSNVAARRVCAAPYALEALWYARSLCSSASIAVDRLRSPHVADACADLRKRLHRTIPYAEIEVRAGNGKDPRAAMREESARITRHLRADDRVWLLERTGTQLSSPALASRLEEVDARGAQRLTLVVGGYVRRRRGAARTRRVSVVAFGVDLPARVGAQLVLEQLYRAAKIARNEPYHH